MYFTAYNRTSKWWDNVKKVYLFLTSSPHLCADISLWRVAFTVYTTVFEIRTSCLHHCEVLRISCADAQNYSNAYFYQLNVMFQFIYKCGKPCSPIIWQMSKFQSVERIRTMEITCWLVRSIGELHWESGFILIYLVFSMDLRCFFNVSLRCYALIACLLYPLLNWKNQFFYEDKNTNVGGSISLLRLLDALNTK